MATQYRTPSFSKNTKTAQQAGGAAEANSAAPRASASAEVAGATSSYRLKLQSGRMTYLLLSDVHAHMGALEAVLTHAEKHGWDAVSDPVLFLGDAVGYGREPNEVLDRLRELDPAVALRGNHEAVLLRLAADPSLRVAPNYEVTKTQVDELSAANRAFVAQTTMSHLAEQWGAVHGALRTPWEYLISVPVARANEPLMTRPLYFVGHTHVPAVFTKTTAGRWYSLVCRDELTFRLEPGGAAFVNPGSVGGPRDGLGASYGLYDDEAGRVTLYRLPL